MANSDWSVLDWSQDRREPKSSDADHIFQIFEIKKRNIVESSETIGYGVQKPVSK
jgi:hypothetical protein